MEANWQCGGKPTWAAGLWQDNAAQVESLAVKIHHVDAHVPKNWATEEYHSTGQADWAAKINMSQVDPAWQNSGELFFIQ